MAPYKGESARAATGVTAPTHAVHGPWNTHHRSHHGEPWTIRHRTAARLSLSAEAPQLLRIADRVDAGDATVADVIEREAREAGAAMYHI